MIRQTYLLIGRVAAPIALIGLKVFTKLTGRQRVRILVTNEQNEVLLMKSVISQGQWTLPGGGVNYGETIVAAAVRELHEETGINAAESAFIYSETLSRPRVDIPFRAPLFRIIVQRDRLPVKMVNPYEVAQIRWFNRNEMPASLSSVAQYVLKK